MNFPKVKDVNLEILQKMSDRELGRICSTDKYFRELCKNEDFWRNRTVSKFGKYLGNIDEINKFRTQYGFNTWRNYYISIVDFLEKVYSSNVNQRNDREDLRILDDEISFANEEIRREVLTNFKGYKWKRIIENDLVDPNYIFFYEPDLKDDENEELFDYLLSLKDHRIKIDNLLAQLLFDDDANYYIKAELAKKVLLNKVNLKKLIEHVVDFVAEGTEREVNYSVLAVYLKLIKDENKFLELETQLKKIRDKNSINYDILQHIYEFFGKEMESALPKILELLSQYKEKDFVKILQFMKEI